MKGTIQGTIDELKAVYTHARYDMRHLKMFIPVVQAFLELGFEMQYESIDKALLDAMMHQFIKDDANRGVMKLYKMDMLPHLGLKFTTGTHSVIMLPNSHSDYSWPSDKETRYDRHFGRVLCAVVPDLGSKTLVTKYVKANPERVVPVMSDSLSYLKTQWSDDRNTGERDSARRDIEQKIVKITGAPEPRQIEDHIVVPDLGKDDTYDVIRDAIRQAERVAFAKVDAVCSELVDWLVNNLSMTEVYVEYPGNTYGEINNKRNFTVVKELLVKVYDSKAAIIDVIAHYRKDHSVKYNYSLRESYSTDRQHNLAETQSEVELLAYTKSLLSNRYTSEQLNPKARKARFNRITRAI